MFTTAKVSPSGTVNAEDLRRTLKNGLIFLGPTLLVLLPALMGLVPKDAANYALIMWALKVVTELIQRFLQGK